MSVRFTLILLCCLLATGAANAGLKIYYIRHAEGGHQVYDQWKNKPKNTWPPYVGNGDMFTPNGLNQVAALTKKMKGMRFDFIAVSPYWRARNTILPFMKENGYKGEIWPELTEEIDSGMNLPAGSLPYTSADLFNGSRINIPDDEKPYFKLRHDGTRNLKFGRTPPQNAADNRAAIATAIGRIVGIYGGTNKSVLLVGHTVAGQQFLKVLVHNEHIFDRGSRYESGIGNTQMWMAEQQPNGSFKVMILNDKPYTPDADVKSEK